MPAPDRKSLARYVLARRRELGYTQGEVQAAGGPSTAIQREIEHGRGVKSDRSKVRMEQVFGWEAGSIDRILAGGEPTLALSAPSPSPDRTADFDKLEVILVRMPEDATPAQRQTYQRLAELVSQRLIDRVHRYGGLSPLLGIASEITNELHGLL